MSINRYGFLMCLLAVGGFHSPSAASDTLFIDAPAPTTQPKPEYDSALQYPTLEDELKARVAELELRLQKIESALKIDGDNLTLSSPGTLTVKSNGVLHLQGKKVETKVTFKPE